MRAGICSLVNVKDTWVGKKKLVRQGGTTKLHQYFFSHAYPVRIAMLVVLNANPIVRSIISCFQKYMETKLFSRRRVGLFGGPQFWPSAARMEGTIGF